MCETPSFRDGPKDQTRNLEILRCAIAHHSSMLCIAPERRRKRNDGSLNAHARSEAPGMMKFFYSSFPIATAVSAMRFEKPHSLSYHDITRTSVPFTTLVWSMWKVEECGSWLKSIETFGAVV